MYTPPKRILERYADVLVNFALNDTKGIKKDDTVLVIISEAARPLMFELRKAIAKAGGNIILQYLPSDESRSTASPDFYRHAGKEQLAYAPKRYFEGAIADADHSLTILTDADPQALKGIDPSKVVINSRARLAYKKFYQAKELKGQFTWALALYPTQHNAREAGMSLKAYWAEVIKACYLDKTNPAAEWRKLNTELKKYSRKLSAMKIEKLHIEADGTDLWVQIGGNRKWLTGIGANIPSFEIFTSPDWRGTEGKVRFTEPLLRYGQRIEGIELEFRRGKVVKARAKKGEKALKTMISNKNMDKLGEFSLTDGRHSRITKFMATTLFDENVGGAQGNTHMALGSSFKDTYAGDPRRVQKKSWSKMGFNDSPDHTDIMSTSKRKVTATLKGGEEKVIYKNGRFTI